MKRILTAVGLAVAMVAGVSVLGAQTTAPGAFDQVNVLAGALAGLGASALIGVLKKVEASVDTKIVSALGNYTPILVTVLAVLLPKLAGLLHLSSVPDATLLASAPVATIVAIAIRELMVKLGLSKPAGG